MKLPSFFSRTKPQYDEKSLLANKERALKSMDWRFVDEIRHQWGFYKGDDETYYQLSQRVAELKNAKAQIEKLK